MSDLTVTRIESAQLLAARSDEWQGITGGVFFRRWEWLGSWWEAYGADRELFVLEVRDGERLIGAAALYRSWSRRDGLALRLIGSGEVCSDYLGAISAPSRENEVAEALAEWLTNAASSGKSDRNWGLLELDGTLSSDPVNQRWLQRLTELGNSVSRRPAQSCWAVELNDDWEAFLQRFSKNSRKRVRGWLRQLDHSDDTRLVQAQTLGELDDGMRLLIDLHQRRWTARGEPGCFASPRFKAFLERASKRFFSLESVELIWLEDRGRPVAAQIDFVNDDTISAYQSGIDPEFDRFPCGNVLQAATIRRAVARGIRRYDFLRGDEQYKARWRAEPSRCETIRVAPRQAMAQLRNSLWQAEVAVKRWLKTKLAGKSSREGGEGGPSP